MHAGLFALIALIVVVIATTLSLSAASTTAPACHIWASGINASQERVELGVSNDGWAYLFLWDQRGRI